jgi:hypothetical protein
MTVTKKLDRNESVRQRLRLKVWLGRRDWVAAWPDSAPIRTPDPGRMEFKARAGIRARRVDDGSWVATRRGQSASGPSEDAAIAALLASGW